MKRILIVAVVGALAGLGPAAPEPSAPKAAAGYGLEIKIAPKESAPGFYTCEATVTDLATGKVLAAPRVEFGQGKSGTMLSDDETGKREILLTAGVEGNGTRAAYTMEIREGDALVSSQKASVKLR